MMARRVIAGRGGFSPKALFANGEQGVWYDPSDFSTLFQDAAGTIPVTAVEQPVGKILDKSGRGNHATQSANTGYRPTLSARYNLLTKTEQFYDAVWVKVNATVGQNVSVAPNGTTTADALISNINDTEHFVYFNTPTAKANESRIVSFRVKKGTKSWVRVAALNATSGSYPSVKVWFNVDTGQKGTSSVVDATCVLENYAISSIGSGWHLCTMQYKFTADSSGTPNISIMAAASNGGHAYIGDGSSEAIYIWGADLRVANDGVGLPPYQRVNTATDYDTVGFPLYLRFNGSTQFLQTNSIDFSSTDKMLVAAGVRKLSDAARGIVAEFGDGAFATNNFNLNAPVSATPGYAFRSIGQHGFGGYAEITSGYAAPITNILTGLSDISGDLVILRINGAQAASSTADQGPVNYGNYPLYIGARVGTSLYFNGRLYSLIVRGAQTPANLIAATERYVARKTGVTL